MGRRAITIVTVLLMGLISGCSSNDSPPTDNDIFGALITSGGVVSTSGGIDQSSHDDHIPQVASDGSNYLVVYERTVTSTNHDIIGALVDPTGLILRYVNIDTSPNDDQAPRVAFDGTNYLVVYERTVTDTDHDIIGARVDPTGTVLGHVSIDVTANDTLNPAVAFDTTNYLVVYEQTVNSANHDIIGTFVTPAGTPGTPFAINGSSNDDLAAAIAFDGTNYLVVYEDGTINNHDILGTLVSQVGVPGSPFVIANSFNDLLAPSVAFDTANYMVVYQETVTTLISTSHDIIGAQVSPTGGVVVGSPFSINTTSKDDVAPSIAFLNGANYLVAYQETVNNGKHAIIGNRVSPSTPVVVGGAIEIDTPGSNDVAPAVASDGTNYIIVYEGVF